jgi:F-box and leucine-rich repeat protein GRR1
VFALAQSHGRQRDRHGRPIRNDHDDYFPGSSLERVHLSYCTNLTLNVRSPPFFYWDCTDFLL